MEANTKSKQDWLNELQVYGFTEEEMKELSKNTSKGIEILIKRFKALKEEKAPEVSIHVDDSIEATEYGHSIVKPRNKFVS